MNQALREYIAKIACRNLDQERMCSTAQFFAERARVHLARELLDKFFRNSLRRRSSQGASQTTFNVSGFNKKD